MFSRMRMIMFVLLMNLLPSTPAFAESCSELFSNMKYSTIAEGIKYVLSHSDYFTSVYSSSLSKDTLEQDLISNYSLTLDDIAHILIQKRDLSYEDYLEFIKSRLGVDLKEEGIEVSFNLPIIGTKETFNALGFSDEELHLFPSSDLASDIIEADDLIPFNEVYYKLKIGSKYALVKIISSHLYYVSDPIFDEIVAISPVFFKVKQDGHEYVLISTNKTDKDIKLMEFDSISKFAPNTINFTHNGRRFIAIHMYKQYNSRPVQSYDEVVEVPGGVEVMFREELDHRSISFEKDGIYVLIDPYYSIRDSFDRVRKLMSSTSVFRKQFTDSDAIYISQNHRGNELIYTSTDFNTRNEDLHYSFGTFDSIRPIFGPDDKIDFFIVSKHYKYDIVDANKLLDPREPLELSFPYTAVTFLEDKTEISSRNPDYISVYFQVSSQEDGTQTIKLRHIRNYLKNRF